MAAGEARGVSSMPLPPMQYVTLYTDENVKKGRAPKPPPPVKVIAAVRAAGFHYFRNRLIDANNSNLDNDRQTPNGNDCA